MPPPARWAAAVRAGPGRRQQQGLLMSVVRALGHRLYFGRKSAHRLPGSVRSRAAAMINWWS